MQTLQSQGHDSVENEETHKETQGHSNHELREAIARFGCPRSLDAPEAPPKEIFPMPIWRPFEDKPLDECIANIR